MSKKAQGLPVNTIIIAIIVLVVLLVLIMIFTGYIGGWADDVSTCEARGGSCDTSGAKCVSIIDTDGPVVDYDLKLKCKDGTLRCCPVGTKQKPAPPLTP